jgi:hypothetical protein
MSMESTTTPGTNSARPNSMLEPTENSTPIRAAKTLGADYVV